MPWIKLFINILYWLQVIGGRDGCLTRQRRSWRQYGCCSAMFHLLPVKMEAIKIGLSLRLKPQLSETNLAGICWRQQFRDNARFSAFRNATQRNAAQKFFMQKKCCVLFQVTGDRTTARAASCGAPQANRNDFYFFATPAANSTNHSCDYIRSTNGAAHCVKSMHWSRCGSCGTAIAVGCDALRCVITLRYATLDMHITRQLQQQTSHMTKRNDTRSRNLYKK